jgi:hypothetical protein
LDTIDAYISNLEKQRDAAAAAATRLGQRVTDSVLEWRSGALAYGSTSGAPSISCHVTPRGQRLEHDLRVSEGPFSGRRRRAPNR